MNLWLPEENKKKIAVLLARLSPSKEGAGCIELAVAAVII